MNKLPLIFQLICLILGTPTLSGCIESYGATIRENAIGQRPSTSNSAIHFHFSSDVEKLGALHYMVYSSATSKEYSAQFGTLTREYETLQQVFGEVSGATIASQARQKGVYVEVTTTKRIGSLAAQVFSMFHFGFFLALPCYTDTYGFFVHFDVYRDGSLRKSYQYEMTPKKLMWLGVAPIAWVTFLLPTYDDAFRAITYRFVHDAQNDGLLR